MSQVLELTILCGVGYINQWHDAKSKHLNIHKRWHLQNYSLTTPSHFSIMIITFNMHTFNLTWSQCTSGRLTDTLETDWRCCWCRGCSRCCAVVGRVSPLHSTQRIFSPDTAAWAVSALGHSALPVLTHSEVTYLYISSFIHTSIPILFKCHKNTHLLDERHFRA